MCVCGVGCFASSSASIDLPLWPGPCLSNSSTVVRGLLRSYGPRRLLLSGRTSSSPWPGCTVVRAGVASSSRHQDRGGRNSAQLVLVVLLHRARTGFSKSETIINRLIVFSINTGMLTSTFAVLSLITVSVLFRFFCLVMLDADAPRR